MELAPYAAAGLCCCVRPNRMNWMCFGAAQSMLLNSAPPASHISLNGEAGLSHTPLFVLVRLSDYCRLALVLLIFILIFLVYIIVIIGISRWGQDAGEAQPSKRAFKNSGTHVSAFQSVWIAAGRRHFA
jgi:hypothetical protein